MIEGKKRTITLANGQVIELDDLTEQDKNHVQYSINFNSNKKGRTITKRKIPKPSALWIVPKRPEWIPEPEKEKPLTFRQKQFRNNVLTGEELRKRTPKKTKSNNPQGLSRFIFITELRANKCGFIYYGLWIILNALWLLFNIFINDFFVNISLAILALTDFLLLRSLFKLKEKFIVKLLCFLLIVFANVGLFFLGKRLNYLSRIDFFFALKLLFIVCGLYYLGKFYALFAVCYSHDCNIGFGNVVKIHAGPPRCGKTSKAVQDGLILSKLKWQQLTWDYKVAIGREDKILKCGNVRELEELYEIKQSYQFYIIRPCIPCLWSNIGIEDFDGRRSFKVTLDHIRGIEKLPLYSVVILDEIGAVLKSEFGTAKGLERPYEISDMFRLGGHFLKWCVIGCEQDFNNIYIDCRRVVGVNELISGQEWICKPKLLLAVFNFFKWFILEACDKKMKKQTFISVVMYKIEKFIRAIGFRKYSLGFAVNTQTGGQGADSKDSYSLQNSRVRLAPSGLVARYDDRAYKQLYASYFDKNIRGELHESLALNGLSYYSRQFVSETLIVNSKRDAIDDKVRNIV